MDKNEIINQWTASIENGTFLAEKHDPNYLSTTHTTYKTVLTPEMSSSLETFIKSGNYSIDVYKDNNFTSPHYVIQSSDPVYKRIGNEVLAGSMQTGSSCDKLVIVSGSNQGWHIFPKDSSKFQQEIQSGRFVFSSSLK